MMTVSEAVPFPIDACAPIPVAGRTPAAHRSPCRGLTAGYRGYGPHVEARLTERGMSSTNATASVEDAAGARRFVAETLDRLDRQDAVEEAVLCTSELVTNALRHARGHCEITVSASQRTIRIEVHDESLELPRPTSTALQDSGRGLLIIDALASRWGFEIERGNGKSVWCQLETERDEGADGPPSNRT
jgi:anti-sigma regulatory factor (Ser/Thr protein kinase)